MADFAIIIYFIVKTDCKPLATDFFFEYFINRSILSSDCIRRTVRLNELWETWGTLIASVSPELGPHRFPARRQSLYLKHFFSGEQTRSYFTVGRDTGAATGRAEGFCDGCGEANLPQKLADTFAGTRMLGLKRRDCFVRGRAENREGGSSRRTRVLPSHSIIKVICSPTHPSRRSVRGRGTSRDILVVVQRDDSRRE